MLENKDPAQPPVQENDSGDWSAVDFNFAAQHDQKPDTRPDTQKPAEENVYTNHQQVTIHNTDDPPPGGLFDIIYGVLFEPVRTWAQLAAHPPVVTTAIIYITISLLEGLAGVFMAPMYLEGAGSFPMGGGADLMQSMQPFLFIGGFTLAMIKWFLVSGLLHLIAELWGGQGRARGVFTVYALASLPAALIIPLNMIIFLAFAGSPRVTLVGLLGFAAFIWSVVLLILGLGQVHKFSTSKAAMVVIAPALVMFIWLVVAVLIVVAAIPVGTGVMGI